MNCFVKINHSNCAVESAVVSCTNETGSTFSCLYLLQGQKSHLYPLKLYCHKSWTPVVNKYQYMFCVLDASEYKVQNHQVQDCGGYSTGLYCLRTPQHLSGKQPICLTDAIHLVWGPSLDKPLLRQSAREFATSENNTLQFKVCLNIWMVAHQHQKGWQCENGPNPHKACMLGLRQLEWLSSVVGPLLSQV